MPRSNVKPGPTEGLSEELETLPGVRHAVLDGAAERVYLICDSGPGVASVEEAAREVLAASGRPEAELPVSVSYLQPQPLRRVRFVELHVQRPRVGIVEAQVVLEWNGLSFAGQADGEGGSACEIRVCALAAMRALEAILGDAVSLSLVGSKAIRIFDTDLVSVLLHSPQARDRKLLGVSLVTSDPNRSASLAVLNATNRLLGNFLGTTD